MLSARVLELLLEDAFIDQVLPAACCRKRRRPIRFSERRSLNKDGVSHIANFDRERFALFLGRPERSRERAINRQFY